MPLSEAPPPQRTVAVLGAGAIGCIGDGLLARRLGNARVAAVQLSISGALCLASPWPLRGITVAGDSPQFSAPTAANVPRGAVGSMLTLVNSIGFAISALSIEIFVRLASLMDPQDPSNTCFGKILGEGTVALPPGPVGGRLSVAEK